MKLFICLILLCLTFQWRAIAQIDKKNIPDWPNGWKGIYWTEGLSWKEILKKARKENKYIFVDCYATWCGPCKAMEKDEFSKKEVGDFFNEHFISVRLQMDRTKKDGEYVKSMYSTVSLFSKEYGIPAFPTLLFFSPNGELLNRVTGYQQDKSLIQEGKKSMVPGMTVPYRIYYKWLARYQQGKKDFSTMAGLADTAKQLNQMDIANEVAKEYMPYLLQRKILWYTPTNLSFMASFVNGSQDSVFNVFYKNSSLVDSILNNKGLAKYVVDTIIQREEIDPVIKPQKGIRLSSDKPQQKAEPDWERLEQKIAAKYDFDFAKRNVLYARVQWYNDQHEWAMCALYFTILVKEYLPQYINSQMASFINYISWDAVFKRSVNKEQIDAAIRALSPVVVQFSSSYEIVDTYANLLYKAGRVDEAIKMEELALKNCYDDPKGYLETLKRMKQGKPTWPHYISNDFWDSGLID